MKRFILFLLLSALFSHCGCGKAKNDAPASNVVDTSNGDSGTNDNTDNNGNNNGGTDNTDNGGNSGNDDGTDDSSDTSDPNSKISGVSIDTDKNPSLSSSCLPSNLDGQETENAGITEYRFTMNASCTLNNTSSLVLSFTKGESTDIYVGGSLVGNSTPLDLSASFATPFDIVARSSDATEKSYKIIVTIADSSFSELTQFDFLQADNFIPIDLVGKVKVDNGIQYLSLPDKAHRIGNPSTALMQPHYNFTGHLYVEDINTGDVTLVDRYEDDWAGSGVNLRLWVMSRIGESIFESDGGYGGIDWKLYSESYDIEFTEQPDQADIRTITIGSRVLAVDYSTGNITYNNPDEILTYSEMSSLNVTTDDIGTALLLGAAGYSNKGANDTGVNINAIDSIQVTSADSQQVVNFPLVRSSYIGTKVESGGILRAHQHVTSYTDGGVKVRPVGLQQKAKIVSPHATTDGRNWFGADVVVSKDGGTIIATLPMYHDGTNHKGKVYALRKDSGGVWQASEFPDIATNRDYGGEAVSVNPVTNFDVAISDDGNTVVLGYPYTTVAGRVSVGSIQIVKYDSASSQWVDGTENHDDSPMLDITMSPLRFRGTSDNYAGTQFGSSVAISGDGNFLAIACFGMDTYELGGEFYKKTNIYTYKKHPTSGKWLTVSGSGTGYFKEIHTQLDEDEMASTTVVDVKLNEDGSRLFIAENNRVYIYNRSFLSEVSHAWTLVQNMYLSHGIERIEISGNGDILGIPTPFGGQTVNGVSYPANHGKVDIYRHNSTSGLWELSESLLPDTAYPENSFLNEIPFSISKDGLRAVTRPKDSVLGSTLYTYNGVSWDKDTLALDGSFVVGDMYDTTVSNMDMSISGTGEVFVLSAPADDDNGSDSGSLLIYEPPTSGSYGISLFSQTRGEQAIILKNSVDYNVHYIEIGNEYFLTPQGQITNSPTGNFRIGNSTEDGVLTTDF
jgi:hypothetical protein